MFFLFMAALAGCTGSRSLIVLLPDDQGQVGTIQIETTKGTVSVDEPYHAVTVGSPYRALGSSRLMEKTELETRFSPAMAAEPSQRFRFKKQTFYCRRNSTDLMPDSRDALPGAIGQLMSEPPLEIYVVGHADRVGTENYNRQLSRRRALALQDELTSNGINTKMILISFLGESKPQIATADEVEEPRNRRVVLVLKYAKPQ